MKGRKRRQKHAAGDLDQLCEALVKLWEALGEPWERLQEMYSGSTGSDPDLHEGVWENSKGGHFNTTQDPKYGAHLNRTWAPLHRRTSCTPANFLYTGKLLVHRHLLQDL